MTKHDEGRRAFLVGTAAGAAASVTLVPQALAQTHPPAARSDAPGINHGADHPGMTMPTSGSMSAPMAAPMGGGGHGAFFNDDDARTIAAFAERLMPGAPDMPGATDAGVLNYIDLALAGAYADQQEFYRHGLTQLEAHCMAAYAKPFRNLTPAQQDETIAALEQGKSNAFSWPAARAFFNTVHRHTMEGLFSDPVYGGNRDFTGWRLVGFPGAQMQFTEEDMQSADAFTREPIVGMQSRMKMKKG
jgi:gluconate 2-dehydrogenase gamma chain